MGVEVPFVDLPGQFAALGGEIEAACRRVLGSAGFILGAEVEAFEADFAALLDAPHAVGVASGQDALRLSLQALDIGPGDEVIVPVHTYVATALAVSATGATPVFADIEDERMGLDPAGLEARLTPRTRAIVPVHLYGRACDIEGVLAFARAHDLRVVEDACQAHAARAGDLACGTLGDVGCFSFYPSKNLGAAGDGGLAVTRDAELARKLRLLRNDGQAAKNEHVLKGCNSRLDGLQAAILRVKLPHLLAWNAARARHAARYQELLAGCAGLELPPALPSPEHVYHLYVVQTERRDALREHLGSRGIESGIHYPVPIHRQPAYAADAGPASFPVAERAASRILSLPMFPELRDAQIEHVAKAIQEFF